jgi:hypothetical protein
LRPGKRRTRPLGTNIYQQAAGLVNGAVFTRHGFTNAGRLYTKKYQEVAVSIPSITIKF